MTRWGTSKGWKAPKVTPGYTPPPGPGPSVETAAAGYFDPALLTQQAAAARGYGYSHDDAAIQLQRLQDQYGIDKAGINRSGGRTLEDLAASLQRGTQDFASQATRSTEDHTAQLADLQRNYNILAGRQQEGINDAGVLRGGALLQAAAKRAANQANDQAPIDVGYQRQQADIASGLGRLQADNALGVTRAGQDTASALAGLGNTFGNQTQDVTTADIRAGKENAQFGIDTGSEVAYQATQNGWRPPPLPAGRPAGRPAYPSMSYRWGRRR